MRLNSTKRRLKTLIIIGLMFGACSGSYAEQVNQANTAHHDPVSLIRAVIAKQLPDAGVLSIDATPIGELYQVMLDSGEILHVHQGGKYLLSGDLYQFGSPGDIKNITELRRSEGRVSLIKGLSNQNLVTFNAKGHAKSEVFVFTDTDCGYCRKFHGEVAALNEQGVTVHYLAWPRAGIESKTGQTMVDIWCAKDPKSAMTLAKQGRSLPQNETEANCQHPIKKHLAVGGQLGVRGTPAVFLSDGRKVGGYLSADELIKIMF